MSNTMSPRMKVGVGIFLTVLGLAILGAAIWIYHKSVIDSGCVNFLIGFFGVLVAGRGIRLLANDESEEGKKTNSTED